MPSFDLATTPLRDLNSALHAIAPGSNETHFEVLNPAAAIPWLWALMHRSPSR